jgi:glycosyltransferase involved in cell wall biosynthesis
MKTKYSINAFYSNFFSDRLIAYVCLRILYYFNCNTSTFAKVMGISSDITIDKFRQPQIYLEKETNFEHSIPGIYHDAIPRTLIWPLLKRLLTENQLRKIAEFRFFTSIKRDDIAYLWPEASLDLYKKLKSRGCIIVSERINTLRRNSKDILDREYKSLGLPVSHGISENSAEEEIECMALSDYIFSPSPAVKESLVSAGIRADKILDTTYGLKEDEIIQPAKKRPGQNITVIFVGSIGVRKGIHLLLEAWQKADVKATLKIVGKIEPQIADLVRGYLERNANIEHVDFVNDLKPLYQNADLFILPSLEEGSPLVTYLALGASLPVIVSPMGGGGVIEDGKEGVIIDPHNQDALIKSIRDLISDGSLRHKMAEASGKKAIEYTWDRVSKKRIEMLIHRITAVP